MLSVLVERMVFRVTGGSPSDFGSMIAIAGARHVSPLLSTTRLSCVLTFVTCKTVAPPVAFVAPEAEGRASCGGDGGGEAVTTAKAAGAWLAEVNEAEEAEQKEASSLSSFE